MKVTTYQLGDLRKVDPTLYSYILPVAHGVDGDVVEINESKLVPLQRRLLASWAAANNIREPEHDLQTCGCNDCFSKRLQEHNAREKERLEVDARIKAADNRLRWYISQGLVNSEKNGKVFFDFVNTHPKLKDAQVSPGLVDAAISILRGEGKLDWKTPEQTPPAPAPAPAVVILSDGSEQLPIDAPPSTKHTVAQLRDLDARQRALKAGEDVLAPLETGEPRLPLGTKLGPKHSVAQRRDLELRTARAWARQQGSVGGSFFSNDWQVR